MMTTTAMFMIAIMSLMMMVNERMMTIMPGMAMVLDRMKRNNQTEKVAMLDGTPRGPYNIAALLFS